MLLATTAFVGAFAYATTHDTEQATQPAPAPSVHAIDEGIASPARSTEAPISMMVIASPVTVGSHEPLPLTFYAVNRTDHPLSIIRSLDASDVGWRYPKLDLEIRDVDGHLVDGSPIGRCGLVNPLTASDFVELAPGARTNLLGDGTFGHYRLSGPNGLAPGVYTVTLHYDLRFDGPDRASHEPGIDAKLAALPKGRYSSPPITIEVK